MPWGFFQLPSDGTFPREIRSTITWRYDFELWQVMFGSVEDPKSVILERTRRCSGLTRNDLLTLDPPEGVELPPEGMTSVPFR